MARQRRDGVHGRISARTRFAFAQGNLPGRRQLSGEHLAAVHAGGDGGNANHNDVIAFGLTIDVGSEVTLTAKVSPASAGSVTFYDGVAILGTKPLTAGQAVLTTSLLSAGTHAVRAYYSGNNADTPSTSSPIAISVSTVPINHFLTPVVYPLANSTLTTNSIAMGDFNGDGKADVAAVTSNGVSVLLGKGDGTFQAAVNYATNSSPGSVAVGDFNGDGNADLAVTTPPGSVSILLGNGDGTFKPAVSYNTGSNPGILIVGDFNGDGNADLVFGNGYVLLGNGDGTFQSPAQWLPHGMIAVGDFNGDGKPDFVDSTGAVLLGNGDGVSPPLEA